MAFRGNAILGLGFFDFLLKVSFTFFGPPLHLNVHVVRPGSVFHLSAGVPCAPAKLAIFLHLSFTIYGYNVLWEPLECVTHC